MIDVRHRATLGSTVNEQLRAAHHFSFARYQDAGREGWGDLRSVNCYILAPRAELRPQPLDGTEILTIVRKGVIAHAGSFSGKCRVATGEVELMSTGSGMTHAYVNAGNMPAEYLEIRIAAADRDDNPRRDTARMPGRRQSGDLIVLASGFAEDRRAIHMRSDARLLAARLPTGATTTYRAGKGRHVYAVALNGEIAIGGFLLQPWEGAAIIDEAIVRIDAVTAGELLLIDAR